MNTFEHDPSCPHYAVHPWGIDDVARACTCGRDNPLDNYCALHDIFDCPYAHAPNPDHIEDGRSWTLNLEHLGEPVDIHNIPDGTNVTLTMPTGNQHGVWRDGAVHWLSDNLNEIQNDNAQTPATQQLAEAWDVIHGAFDAIGESLTEVFRRMSQALRDSGMSELARAELSEPRPTGEFLQDVDELLTANDQMRALPDMQFDNLGLLVEDDK